MVSVWFIYCPISYIKSLHANSYPRVVGSHMVCGVTGSDELSPYVFGVHQFSHKFGSWHCSCWRWHFPLLPHPTWPSWDFRAVLSTHRPHLLGGITNSLVQGNNMHEYSKGQLEQHRKEPLRWGDKIDSSPPGLLEEVVGLLNFWCTRNQALIWLSFVSIKSLF